MEGGPPGRVGWQGRGWGGLLQELRAPAQNRALEMKLYRWILATTVQPIDPMMTSTWPSPLPPLPPPPSRSAQWAHCWVGGGPKPGGMVGRAPAPAAWGNSALIFSNTRSTCRGRAGGRGRTGEGDNNSGRAAMASPEPDKPRFSWHNHAPSNGTACQPPTWRPAETGPHILYPALTTLAFTPTLSTHIVVLPPCSTTRLGVVLVLEAGPCPDILIPRKS